ncbi:hypothetical protein BLA29_015359, partial [Euroglyphus maynei]
MDAVFRHLELIEREYFALQFTEIFRSSSSNVNNQQQQQDNNVDNPLTIMNNNCSP